LPRRAGPHSIATSRAGAASAAAISAAGALANAGPLPYDRTFALPFDRSLSGMAAGRMMFARSTGFSLAPLLLALLCLPRAALAGGGPENVLVVVNTESWASQTVANHFLQLRQIPPINVVYLPWNGSAESIDGETFRNRIFTPVLDAMQRRGLAPQIDYVVYSSDFPYAIDLTGDFAKGSEFPPQIKPACSLNSATYLWNLVYARQPIVMDFSINHYMRDFTGRKTKAPTHGFRSWYGWDNEGDLIEAGGQPYLLSTMLAMTAGRGNSVREAIGYLRRSASADGTRPKGTIYLSRTSDIRSTARAPEFTATIAELQKLGVKAQAISSPLPQARPDVAGLVTGTAEFDWPRSRSTLLPGAICDNLTSFGGVLAEGSSQTPLSAFLRGGAAGASGTIVEPMLIKQKFPWTTLQLHYARGSTLAEAFYQSVYAPAQLLIVGDPLCRPWANIPQVTLAGIKPGARLTGSVELKVEARVARPSTIDTLEAFVDGRRVATVRAGEPLVWDTTSEIDGYHELRVVAIESLPIQSQGRAVLPVWVDNHHHQAQLAVQPAGKVRYDQTLRVRAKAPGMKEILIVHNGRLLGKVDGPQGEVAVNPRLLGLGPLEIHALAARGTALGDRVAPVPVALAVELPELLPALKDAPQRLAPGLVVRLGTDKVVAVQDTRDPAWLSIAGLDGEQPFTAQAFFDVPDDDLYQFQVWHYGQLRLSVDGVLQYDEKQGNFTQKYLPVGLAKGRHRLTFSGTSSNNVKLRILFGGPGALSLNGRQFKHQTR
jgi:hypothetical protein